MLVADEMTLNREQIRAYEQERVMSHRWRVPAMGRENKQKQWKD